MMKAYFLPADGEAHHYTDSGGLIGIIQNRALWATNIQFLNDSLEFDFGLQRVTAAMKSGLDRVRNCDSGNTPFSEALEKSVETAVNLLEGVGKDSKSAQFVCCFSSFPDDLSQWRGYAREGYCITFDAEQLMASITDHQDDKRSVRSAPVTYGDGTEWGAIEYMDTVLARMHEILDQKDLNFEDYGYSETDPFSGGFVKANDRHTLSALAGVAAVQQSIPFRKDAGFADEQEIRVCVSYPKAVKFRPSRIGPLPYTELKFDPAAIKTVTVGPGLNTELRQATLESLLTYEFGKDHEIEVKTTELSFRG
ncbi:MAG: DUF2971 domain-containing protein [Rhodococcus sp. (in: high G+C Gram-positive bacteria)]|nr:DUF2971 domain-containing protein [Rhodococcus sp. (in: high G+C Gram-positive bacteria)]